MARLASLARGVMRHRAVLSAVRRGALAAAVVVFLSAGALAATVEVKVTDPDGNALPGVTATLVPSNREAVTGSDGVARFESVAPGAYDVSVRLSGFTPFRTDVTVVEGNPLAVPVTLATQVHFSESITVSPNARDIFESYQPASVLGGEDLQQRLGGTLGATLASEPGVNVRTFGSGNARPVVRGLDNDRVLILENGARTGDLSSQSADHGVTLDPATATQIEVVRGPATLLYGSSAIGGVVNLVSDEIVTRPEDRVHGAFTLQGATADENAGIAGNLSGGTAALPTASNGSAQRTDDYETPTARSPTASRTPGPAGARSPRPRTTGTSAGPTSTSIPATGSRSSKRAAPRSIPAPRGGPPRREAEHGRLFERGQVPGRLS